MVMMMRTEVVMNEALVRTFSDAFYRALFSLEASKEESSL
jgi:hypothetical protein